MSLTQSQGFQWDDDYDEGGRYCEDKEAGIASYEEMKGILLYGEHAIYSSDLAALFKSVCKRIHAKSTPSESRTAPSLHFFADMFSKEPGRTSSANKENT